MATRQQELEAMRDAFTPGQTVLVRGFSGIACYYRGPETERGPTEYEAECYACDGTGANDDLDGALDDNNECLECAGSGIVLEHDEEPEDVPTGRAIVVMVGDDHKHVVDFEDLSPVDEDDVCTCGQLGCWSNNNTMGGES